MTENIDPGPLTHTQLLDQVRNTLRARHYSPRTEKSYVHWIRRFIRFHDCRHPRDMGADEVCSFLSSLAVRHNVAASTQNQALAALLFLYRKVLGIDLPWLEDLVRAKRPRRLPTVLSRPEVRRIFDQMSGIQKLMTQLLYGSGMRLLECCKLRVKDIDFDNHQIFVRRGKGAVDRVTLLPAYLVEPLRQQLDRSRTQHEKDLAEGSGWVELPGALARKLPNAAREWPWQWVFPATRHYEHPETGQQRRHHYHESVIQKAIRAAAKAAGLTKRVTSHTFRHSFATHLLEDGYDIRTVQRLLGHKDVRATMIYTHVLNRGPHGVRSPLDRPEVTGDPERDY